MRRRCALKTSMPTAFATTSTIASARWTLAACATVRRAVYECGCDDLPQGDCDCNGNQVDALGVCAGTCEADSDGDGVCDDIDDCIGVFDACGICNGPGDRFTNADAQTSQKATATATATNLTPSACAAARARPTTMEMAFVTTWTTAWVPSTCAASAMDRAAVLECGCYNLIPGFCDCDWNQYDALGVCGGTCARHADVDGDGVCDDVDDCVGRLFDACGICNGPW